MTEIDAQLLFRAEPHTCCECCFGYCPEGDLPEKDRWDALFNFHASGVEYVGDRRVMVRRDALVGIPAEVPIIESGMVNPDFAAEPEVKPPPFAGKHTALHFDRLDLAALECRGNGTVVHVYAGEDHVGWSTVASADAKAAISEDQLGKVRRIARAASISINAAAVALAAAEDAR
ncbi:hypothetical protein [Pimelobacter simplex]|uniref:hypothetical protein n=1 Tax=Nocardioides simplex TaxID=2045 RepID=UPI003AAF3688